jgi:hypothetical protein
MLNNTPPLFVAANGHLLKRCPTSTAVVKSTVLAPFPYFSGAPISFLAYNPLLSVLKAQQPILQSVLVLPRKNLTSLSPLQALNLLPQKAFYSLPSKTRSFPGQSSWTTKNIRRQLNFV